MSTVPDGQTHSGVSVAAKALHHFLGDGASRELAAAALAVWRQAHGWLLADGDDEAVLATFDPSDWPRSIHHHEGAERG